MISTLRNPRLLDGVWDFIFLGKVDLDTADPCNVVCTDRIPVPSAYDALPSWAGKRGVAVYRTTFELPAGRSGRLAFGAVSMWARVYVDGQPAFEQSTGYVPFEVPVVPSSGSTRELVVLVDNRFDFERSPMHGDYFDFYQYGGIIRPVTLRTLPSGGFYLEAVRVIPTADCQNGSVRVEIDLSGQIPAGVSLTMQFDGGETLRHVVPRDRGEGLQFQLSVPDPAAWSPDSPHLHRLRVALLERSGEEVDDAVVRFGLRLVEARDGQLFLNGERLILRGYNRHEWHPVGGPATSTMQMVADLQLLRKLGCNFVRGSHYPQDQRFLDLCDEMGMLVWEENLGWGQDAKTFASDRFCRDHLASLRAMARASANHPCVILWGFLNEAWSEDPLSRPVFEASVTALRELEDGRLISFASYRPFTDLHFDLVDVISLNIYPGWYGCAEAEEPLELISPAVGECLRHLDAAGWADKPVLISEIGCEGLYGWHEAHDGFFSEEYQADYLTTACEAVLGRSRTSGIALWQFCDVRTYGAGRSLMRPRTFNNKGTLDEYRRPKAAFAAVGAVFRKFPVHAIAAPPVPAVLKRPASSANPSSPARLNGHPNGATGTKHILEPV